MSKYQIKCNFKEKLIEIDIARFFGRYLDGSGFPYFLDDTNEQKTGADLVSADDEVLPIYMQVKVSEGLKTISTFPSSNRKNRSKLEDIREYRNELELDYADDYFLYFQLRKKAEKATDFQHNVLMKYASTGYSHGFYVAPLSIDKEEYERMLFAPIDNGCFHPFRISRYELRHRHWVSHFGWIPFLRNHISIIPHEEINTHEHYYAYSKQGIDVTWHSPEFINGYPTRLSDTLINIFNRFYYNKDKISIEKLSRRILKMPIMQEIGELDQNLSPIQILEMHGKLLYEKYNIMQVLFINRTEN